MNIRKINNYERTNALSLLKESHLPVDDISGETILYGLFENNELAGVIGLEEYGNSGLLRSLCTSSALRSRGKGTILVHFLEEQVKEKQIQNVYLLTETASTFFDKRGYRIIQREDVPESIRKTSQFASVCPTTAIVMHKKITDMKKEVLFVCIENSNRSQMAEAFAKIHGGDMFESYSSGSRPSGKINPKAIFAMQELGYDLTVHNSKSLQEVSAMAPFDAVVTMGCGDACPWMPAKTFIDWQIPDPRDMDEAEFRRVRDLIEQKVKELLISL